MWHNKQAIRQKEELEEVEKQCRPYNLSVSVLTFLTRADDILDMEYIPKYVALPRCPECVGFCNENRICKSATEPLKTTVYFTAVNLTTKKVERHKREVQYHQSCACRAME